MTKDTSKSKKFYKTWQFWLIIAAIFIGVGIGSGMSSKNNAPSETDSGSVEPETTKTNSFLDNSTSEQANAYYKAKTYSETMHMSKRGIYNQLISEYGEGFAPEDAQWAVDNLEADYKANALEKAKTYSETMHMSKQDIYNQLISEYGEKFTAEEAQWAIDNLQ